MPVKQAGWFQICKVWDSQREAAPVTSTTESPKFITNAEINIFVFTACEKPDGVIFINELHIFMGLTFYPETSRNSFINAQEIWSTDCSA